MRNTIKQIVFEEFSKLTDLIEKDFAANYKRKVNNFLLSQMDENITASMVFVSSFESKSGFAIETCAKRIARLKFGEKMFPLSLTPETFHTILMKQEYRDRLLLLMLIHITVIFAEKFLLLELITRQKAQAKSVLKAV